ncbi:putative ABC transport system ATP-binding protein [Sedimentibacter acidaminivorans]|uniref:ABC transport system ATP-binding protein n=1 Tax=Sedimentibacter acidaminivorans TaxID=913099 RepID=A0ABS4GF60_9FIRM|nr:ABC transporter ATP-binding protein [Sedimentibacter acidaminivorans]MBP1926335.1 putative ABC transport system ATP-binding protein [Sedimentibacter acidaminivorans]
MIDLVDLYKIYKIGDSEIRALDGINLHIDKNEFVAIVGQSGSGKSTCMNMIGCLDIPTSGKFILNGKDASKLKEDELSEIRNLTLGFIFQQYNLISKLNVFENVELPLIYRGVEKNKRKKMVEESLERVDLTDRILNMPSQLSGGQQQRVSIARALSGNPPVILADEPTGALDSKTGAEVLELLKEINREGNTIVLITHDNFIAQQAKRIVRLHDGKIIEDKVLGVAENEL